MNALLICALVTIGILMLGFVLFILGRVFENTITIRDLEENIEMLKSEIITILESRRGE